MTERREGSRRDVDAATLETRVFDKAWGACHSDANALVSSKVNYDFANATSATRAAALAAVSDVDGIDCVSEHPFGSTAVSHSKTDPWPGAVLSAVAPPSSTSSSLRVDSSLTYIVRNVFESLSVQAAAALRDKLEGTNGIPAPSVLAALQPLEAIWVKEAMWLPSGACATVAGDVECEFENSRQFGEGGLFGTAEVPKPETNRHRPRRPAGAASSLRALSAPVPLRKSSNAVDKQIGNRFSNKRLANGPGRSPALTQLGPSRSKAKSAFYSSAKRNAVETPEAIAAKQSMACMKERAAHSGNGPRMEKLACADPEVSALPPDAAETKKANERVRLENPKYKRLKAAEARAKRQKAEEEARKAREAAGDVPVKTGGKRARALERRREREAKKLKRYELDPYGDSDRESQDLPGTSEEHDDRNDACDEGYEADANDDVKVIDLDGHSLRRLGSDRSDGRRDDGYEGGPVTGDYPRNRDSSTAPSVAPNAAFQAVASYRSAGTAHGMSGPSRISSPERASNDDMVQARRHADMLDDAQMKQVLTQIGSHPSGDIWHSYPMFKEIQAFFNGDERVFESTDLKFKDYKLAAIYEHENMLIKEVRLRLIPAHERKPNEPRHQVYTTTTVDDDGH